MYCLSSVQQKIQFDRDVYLAFCCSIDQPSAQRIMTVLAHASQADKVEHVHLLFQSMGGDVGCGIALYNFFRNYQKRFTIYNGGTVGSIAFISYLGAENRKVNQFSTFMWHRITRQFPGAPDSKQMEDALKSMGLNDRHTRAILEERVHISKSQWSHLANNEFWFSAEDAVKSGIATEIGDFAPPKGTPFYSV
jgi:ATP-dependent protease ClpP protease subunit